MQNEDGGDCQGKPPPWRARANEVEACPQSFALAGATLSYRSFSPDDSILLRAMDILLFAM
jgi:hypothetical protein